MQTVELSENLQPRSIDTLTGRARFVECSLIAFVVLSLAGIAATAGQIAGLVDIDAAELDAVSVAAGLGMVLVSIAMLVCVLATCLWVYRVHANLQAAGVVDLEFTPRWAVGWYFVPFANMFNPFRVMREAWNASHLEAVGPDHIDAPRILVWWWGLWIGGSVLGNLAIRFGDMVPPGEKIAFQYGDAVSQLLLMAAAICLLRIVRAITTAQRDLLSMRHVLA